MTMGWRDTWYPNAMAALCELRGRGPAGSDGIATPLIRAMETISVLGQLSQAIVNACSNFQDNAGVDALHDYAFPSELVRNGRISNTLYAAQSELEAHVRPMVDYIAGYAPNKSEPWKRLIYGEGALAIGATSIAVTGYTYEIGYGSSSLTAEPALFAQVRELIAAWDRAVEASASAIRYAGADAQRVIDAANASALFTAVRQVCTALDVLRENPPVSSFDKVKGAAEAALDKTADFAGEAVAKAAAKTGETLGAAGEGFFREAGFMSYLVAGLAVMLFIR